MRPKYLIVGETHRPHGLAGEIAVSSLTDFPDRFREGAVFYLNPPVPEIENLVIERIKETPRGYIVKFAGVSSREDAEAIGKRSLVVPAEEASQLPEGDIWIHDIIGLEVHTVDGQFLGLVKDVLRTGSNDVYVVQNGKEYLIPAIADIVKEISLEDNKMLIEPIPGLLE
jgi:16S rRNA processing protein RimM